MGFVVLLIVCALVGLFVGVAKSADSTDSGPGARSTLPDRGWSDAEFDEDLDPEFMCDEALSRKGGGRIFGAGGSGSDFERLMRPGSDEAAWFNAADEAGYDPENW